MRVGPSVVEKSKEVNVQLGFNWEFSTQEVKTGNWRFETLLKKSPENFILKDLERLHFWWTYGERG